GAAPITRADGATEHFMANIDTPRGPVARTPTTANVEPAGFGPIPGTWPQRAEKVGAIDASYMKERWTWYPRDLEWGYFNAAPADQQVDGYLRGDETLLAEGLHPTSPYRRKLPAVRVRCFINQLVKARQDLD